MDVRILGAVEVWPEGDDTEPTSVGGPRQRRILSALALWHDTVVSIDRLVEVTWPNEDAPAQADRNVRTYVHRIRTALPEAVADRLVTQAPGYLFHLAPGELDADRFERGVAEAERLRDQGNVEGALGRVDDAMEHWRGEPLAEFSAESWARGEVARLEEAHIGALELRCDLLVALDRSSGALSALEQLIEQHPFRERPRALQMRALYASGRQAEALRAFQAFRELLIDEVGVTPSQELVDLDRVIATGGSLAPEVSNGVRGYELHELIGTGAFADVHRGTQPTLGRDVAIKSIRAELANQPDFIRGFEAEASMVARLEHPHIVPLYDFWREPDRAFLVMRWLTGGSLEANLDQGPWQPERVATMVEQVGGALALAHRAGVVHRDVKSANILLDEEGNAYLTDFGIAVEAAGEENPAARLSAGSPAYASPEQLRREEVGPATDIHGLAIASFEALTGRLPFRDAQDEPTLLRRQLHDPIPPASSLRPTLPTRVDDVLARATAKDPAERHRSVLEFVADFVAAFGDTYEPDGVIAGGAGTVLSGPVDNPYLGLRAFDEGDASTFFGRERLVAELVDRMGSGARGDNLLAIVGPSGSGKSSVVRAGLVPALRNGALDGSQDWFITTMTPGAHPYEAIEAALLRVAVNPPASLLEQLRSDKRGLIRGARRILPTEDGVTLVVIDQFEELFTLCTDEAERAAFLDALAVAVTDVDSPLRVVLTLRADFYDQPLRHAAFAELIKQRTVAVTPLAADELEQAITGPARAAGAAFEPGLVAEIVADVAQEPGALPLMQHALRELFDARISGMMLRSTYDDLGGLAGALGRRAEELHDGLDPVGRAAARRIFGRLISLGEGAEDTRRRVRRPELGGDAGTEAMLDAFGSARLLSFDRDPATREPTVEVAHEALIREWPRLRGWLDEDRAGLRVQRAVTDAAERWEASGHDPGDLLRGGRLEAAVEYADGGELTAGERELVSASVEARNADARRTRRTNSRLRRLTLAVSVVALLALIAGAAALVQQNRAAGERDTAQQAQADAEAARSDAETAQADAEGLADELQGALTEAVDARGDAETSRMAGLAPSMVDDDRRLGVLLAREAYNRNPGITTASAIQRALVRTGPIIGYLGEAHRTYYDARWLPDGRLVVVSDEGLEIFGPTGESLATLDVGAPRTDQAFRAIAAGPLTAFDVSEDGRFAALSLAAGGLAVIDLAAATWDVFSEITSVSALGFARDSHTIAVGSTDGRIEIWNAESGDRRHAWDAHTEEPGHFRDQQIDLGMADPLLVEEALPGWLAANQRGVAALLWTDGGTLLTHDYPIVRVWEAQSGAKLREFFPTYALPIVFFQGLAPLDASGGLVTDRTDPDVVVAAGRNYLYPFNWRTGESLPATKLPADRDDTNQTEAGIAQRADGTWWVSLSDGRLRSLPGADAPPSPTIEPGLLAPASLSLDADERTLALAGRGGIALVALDGRQPLADALPRGPTVEAVAVSQGGDVVVASGFIFGPTDVYRRSESGYVPQDFPEDLRRLAGGLLGSEEVRYVGFDLATFGLVYSELDGSDPIAVDALNFGSSVSPDLQWATTTGGPLNRQLTVHRWSDFSPVVELDALPETFAQDYIISSSFDADSARLLATTQRGAAVMWETGTWEEMPIPASVGPIVRATFSPDGSHVATVDPRGEVMVRDAESFEEIRVLDGVEPPLDVGGFLRWSADGSLLLGAFGNRPRVWDVSTGQLLGTPYPHDPAVTYLPEDFSLATAVDDHILVWNLDVASWPEVACEFAGRNMTQAEWERFGPADEPYRVTCPQFPPGV